jgi:hypothetical protein
MELNSVFNYYFLQFIDHNYNPDTYTRLFFINLYENIKNKINKYQYNYMEALWTVHLALVASDFMTSENLTDGLSCFWSLYSAVIN